MSEFGPLTFRQLLIKYALPLWKSILLLTIGTLTSSILAAAQPAIVAAILNTLMQQGPSSPEPVPSSPFDLNYLGSRTVGLLSPIGGDSQTILLALGAIYAVQAIMVSDLCLSSIIIQDEKSCEKRVRHAEAENVIQAWI